MAGQHVQKRREAYAKERRRGQETLRCGKGSWWGQRGTEEIRGRGVVSFKKDKMLISLSTSKAVYIAVPVVATWVMCKYASKGSIQDSTKKCPTR